MRDNPVKAKIAAGGRAFGAMVFELFSPGLPQICKNAGADFILYDMEHTGLGLESLKTQFAICRGLGLTPVDAFGAARCRYPSRKRHCEAAAPTKQSRSRARLSLDCFAPLAMTSERIGERRPVQAA